MRPTPDAIASLLDLAATTDSDGVRFSVVRRIAALAAAERDKIRAGAEPKSVREALLSAPEALVSRPSVRTCMDGAAAIARCAYDAPLDQFLVHAIGLGSPSRRRRRAVTCRRATRIGRALLACDRAAFDKALDALGAAVCAVLIRDLDRARARQVLALLGDDRGLARLAAHLPPASTDVSDWTDALFAAAQAVRERPIDVRLVGASLAVMLCEAMSADVAVAVERRIGSAGCCARSVPAEWIATCEALVGGGAR